MIAERIVEAAALVGAAAINAGMPLAEELAEAWDDAEVRGLVLVLGVALVLAGVTA